MSTAKFGPADHAISAGWATYHKHPKGNWWQRAARCLVFGHLAPIEIPPTPNGHSPNNYAKCVRCDNHLRWYILGQHRYGGMNADTYGVTV